MGSKKYVKITDEECLRKVGPVLKALREEKGYTSYETFAYEFGLARMQYWRMEKGKTNVTIKSLLSVLRIHKVTLGELMTKAGV